MRARARAHGDSLKLGMDRDWGSKPGSAGVASGSQANVDRRSRLAALALETVDLNKDPYFMKNHLGSYECKLCLTIHIGEGSYLAHTQGKRHQENIARRGTLLMRLRVVPHGRGRAMQTVHESYLHSHRSLANLRF